ncbi:hypothetical protein BVG16_11660 [Paenibacillus selenitireducens]|uniref:Uncharacterized protein n=1 Tax=Paenibacillus selenitireducens TaxID=1324314 RepID=A0A1T2XF57_9BACL|nr:hypothetical protein [Paenibacillus selenitireducens]OPA78519.1 hypothetical protein BVG16_11660 [Paenibacillus selenitireducens]
MAKGKVVKKKKSTSERAQYNMKIVTSDRCEACKQQCARGIRYMEHMRLDGAMGKGVPCILTRTLKSK